MAGKDTIWSTVTHPFVSASGSVIAAANLSKGMLLRKTVASVVLASSAVFVPDAQAVVVDSVAIVDTSATVYNLKVEQFDAYLVGQQGMVVADVCSVIQGLTNVFDNFKGLTGPAKKRIAERINTLNITSQLVNNPAVYTNLIDDLADKSDYLAGFKAEYLDAWKILDQSNSRNIRKNIESVEQTYKAITNPVRPSSVSDKEISDAISASSSKADMIDNLANAKTKDDYEKALKEANARELLAQDLKSLFPKGSAAVSDAVNINRYFKKFITGKKLLTESIDILASGVPNLGDIYKAQFKDFLTKLRSPDYASFRSRYQDGLITNYFPADWLTRSDIDELTKEIFEKMDTWENFFDGMGYQVHHIFPVNLFKNSNGFKIYYEFFAGDVLDFNALKDLRNALMLQGKKVDGSFVLGVHTNHDYYETAIGAYLDLKANSYIKNLKISGVETVDDLFKKVTDPAELQDKLSKVANLLDDDVNEIAQKLKPLLIEKSIKGEGNKIFDVNDVLIKNEANPEQSIIDLLTN